MVTEVRNSSVPKTGAILACLVVASLGACGGAEPKPDPAAAASRAIKVGADMYMVPIGADADGCPQFRAYSPTRLTAQAIYYRTAAGAFVIDRNQADCSA